jgi:putative CocE/NonD family hydrolase
MRRYCFTPICRMVLTLLSGLYVAQSGQPQTVAETNQPPRSAETRDNGRAQERNGQPVGERTGRGRRSDAQRDGDSDDRPGGARRRATGASSDGNSIKASYTKYEYMIPMRDGVRLFTVVYVPKDTSDKYPMLMVRTPYSCRPYGVDEYPSRLGPGGKFADERYIFVSQDVRGCWMSEGQFVDVRPHIADKRSPSDVDEASDTWDTIDWLIKNVPGNNGRVGQWGISYPGFYTAAGMIDAHPALKASSPQAPLVDWFMGDDWHHNGALQLAHGFNFLVDFGRPRPGPIKRNRRPRFEAGTPDAYQFFLDMGPLREAEEKYMKGRVAFWQQLMEHGTYDEFWQARNLRPHMKNIRHAVMTVGGWFDAENLFGALETYRSVERLSPESENTIVMGPWSHGGWGGSGASLGDVSFNADTGEYFRDNIQFPFFERHLKGERDTKRPEAWVFQTGTNQWREYDDWPPRNVEFKDLFLRAGGKLAFTPADEDSDEPGYDQYWSNPHRPVPIMEGTSRGMPREYMVADQRFAARRPDVLVYQTEILGTDLAVAGPIEVELHVATSGTDADWVVKIIDVYPNDRQDPSDNPRGVRYGGYQQLVRGDVFRGKFRESFEEPMPFVPDEPTRIVFSLHDICHVFRPGHRLMVQIHSSWFPLFDRNPQKFVDIYSAGLEDFQTARQRVYLTADRPTRLKLPVLP